MTYWKPKKGNYYTNKFHGAGQTIVKIIWCKKKPRTYFGENNQWAVRFHALKIQDGAKRQTVPLGEFKQYYEFISEKKAMALVI